MIFKKRPPKKIDNVPKVVEGNPFVEFQIAIVEQAVKDFEIACFYDQSSEKIKLKSFFKSDWGQTLTEGHGEEVIARVVKETKQMRAAVAVEKARYIKTNIEATEERVQLLEENRCLYKAIENGCFVFRSFASFRTAFTYLKTTIEKENEE